MAFDNLAQLLDPTCAVAPDRVALVLDGVPTTYAELSALAVARAAELPPGQRVVAAADSGPDLMTTLLGAAHAGGSTALVNPRFTAAERAAIDESLAAAPRAADEAVVLFTSGTTGRPKPVPHSQAALTGRIGGFAVPAVPEPQVRLLCVPMFHVGGLLGLFVSLYAGHATVVQQRFDAGEWLRLAERHRVQVTFLVPTMLARLLDHPDFGATDLSALESVTYGAAPMPPDLMDRALEALPHVAFTNTFGQTETLGGISFLTADDHRDPRRRGSCGQLLPTVVARYVGPDGEDAPADQPGELWIGQPDGSWLRTGDLVRRDDDGYLYVVGRVAELVNRGGEKFSPLEVETVLREHPAVRDAAVGALPHADLGQVAGAVVVGDVDDAELRAWCRSRLSAYKVPDRFVFTDGVPVTELGKVDRRAVVALLTEGE